MTLRHLLAKDARVLVRARALLAALLAYPFLLALVLGAAFAEPPSSLDLVVVNEDRAGAALDVGGEPLTSDDLVLALAQLSPTRAVATEAEALSILRRGDADAVLVIPRGFMAQVAALGQSAALRVVVDESDPVRAEVARNAVTGAIDEFVQTIVQRKIDDVLDLLQLTVDGGTTRVGFLDVRVLGLTQSRQHLVEVLDTVDPNGEEARKLRDVIVFLDFAATFLGNAESYLTTTAMPVDVQVSGLSARRDDLVSVALPGALVLGVFWTGSLASSLLVARDRETGVHRRLLAVPTPRALLAASKVVVGALAALLPAILLLALGLVALGAVVRDPALTIAVLLLASLAAVALGGLAALVARTSAGAALLVVLGLLPMVLLGGLFYPVAYMPPAAQAVASVLPLTLATDALRGAVIRGSSLAEMAPPLLGLVAFALVAALAAWLLSRRSSPA